MMEKLPISFMPNLHLESTFASFWLRQVNLRLRREIYWCWHERGLISDSNSQDETILPPFSNKAVETINKSRNWDKKNQFFNTDISMKYLTEQIQFCSHKTCLHQDGIPVSERGSFEWVAKELDLDSTSMFVLALGLAVFFDSDVESVISACLNDPTKKNPGLSLAQKLWDCPERVMQLADPSHCLYRYGLLQYPSRSDNDFTEIDWDCEIKIPYQVAGQLLYQNYTLDTFLYELRPDMDDKNFSVDPADEILVTRLESAGKNTLKIIPVYGKKYSGHLEKVFQIAKISNRKVVEFRGDPRMLKDHRYMNSIATLCWLKGIDLYFGVDTLNALQSEGNKDYLDFVLFPLQSIPVNIFIGITDYKQLASIPKGLLLPTVNVQELSYSERANYWKKSLGQKSEGLNDVILEYSRRFRFGKESINAISEGLIAWDRPLTQHAFEHACRAEIKMDFDNLTQKINPRFSDEDLVLPPKQMLVIKAIENAMKSLTKVHYGIGTGEAWNDSGIFVLFSGPSGSGKTMAAEILATKLDLPLYRIDLSQVVNKYIGETEKNLKRIFDEAEAADVILFFDEADSIFGRRTEVKDAHDLYANQQISYLLERIEHFRGLVILATNRKKDIDTAFARRLRYLVEFPFPGVKERERIWCQLMPKNIDSSQIDTEFLARQFQLSGGNIRSIILNACLQCTSNAASDYGQYKYKLTMEEVIIALRREYEKLNRSINLEQFGNYANILKRIGYE